MEIKRNIYQNLLNWKKKSQEHILLLSGTRYVGKTYILKKFGQENFEHVTYINMVETSGKEFCRCLNINEDAEKYDEFLRALALYDINFVNDGKILVIIDEVQEYPILYNYIRMSMNQNRTYIICTGSYLDQATRVNFLQISEKVESLGMESLSFQEFFNCLQENESNEVLFCEDKQHISILEKMKIYYNLYQIIGGYPEIVITYLKDKDLEKCQRMIKKYTDTWVCESRRYLPYIRENSYVEKVFHILALLMVQNKAVKQELFSGIESIIGSDKEEVGLVIRTINFMEEIGVINFDTDEEKNQYYFADIGVANYYLSRTGATRKEIKEILLEMLVLKNTYNDQQYKEALEMIAEPISINQFPRIKIDLRGMIEYAKTQEKKVVQLTDVEKRRYIHIC